MKCLLLQQPFPKLIAGELLDLQLGRDDRVAKKIPSLSGGGSVLVYLPLVVSFETSMDPRPSACRL